MNLSQLSEEIKSIDKDIVSFAIKTGHQCNTNSIEAQKSIDNYSKLLRRLQALSGYMRKLGSDFQTIDYVIYFPNGRFYSKEEIRIIESFNMASSRMEQLIPIMKYIKSTQGGPIGKFKGMIELLRSK